MPVGAKAQYKEAQDALMRVQDFDISQLPREADLGKSLSFQEAAIPATLLVDLFKRLSIQALDDFPDQVLNVIRDQANNVYNLFDQILKFDVAQGNPQASRQSIINGLIGAYAGTFQSLHPYIAYSLHRSADFQRLDAQARATLQSVEDRANAFSGAMKKHEEDAMRVLGEIRKVAAEEGVTQQAAHFRTEAESHESKAEEWRNKTVKLAWLLGAFAVASLFIHKIPFLKPETAYDAVQLALSKVLLFAVITYMLVLSAKNFMNHRHNAVVNKHRQNALMTHRALVEGAADGGMRDAVMVHAASCIFSPQPTGYTQGKSDGDMVSPRSIVEILSKPIVSSARDG